MNAKLKMLGLGLLMTAIGAFSAPAATGETGGHLLYEVDKGTLKGIENATHRLEFSVPGLTGIVCPIGFFEGTFTSKTSGGIDVGFDPTEKCMTTGGPEGGVPIHFNGCKVKLKIGKKAEQDNTTELTCPAGKVIEVTHPSCTIKVPPGEGFRGVSYKNIIEDGKHALTVEFTVGGGGAEMEVYFESGICVLLGTAHNMVVTGSFTYKAFDENGTVHVTAKGSEDK